MPKQYEEIKKSYLNRGKPLKEAKRLAAMTFIGHSKNPSKAAKSLKKDKKKKGPSIRDF